MVACSGPVAVCQRNFPMSMRGNARAQAARKSRLYAADASPQSRIHICICSKGVAIAGSFRAPRRHARMVVVQGCVPAGAKDRTAALRMAFTWGGAAPQTECP